MVKIRITGGVLKGRSLAVPENEVSRYTSSKVREAVFTMIGDVTDLSVLDLFAGSGSFAVEALSRGAAEAVCVEMNKHMADALKKNLSTLPLDKDCLVLNMDVRYAMPFLYKRASNYDIIFMDPPYGHGYIQKTIALMQKNIIYHNDTIFISEYSKRESSVVLQGNYWSGQKTKRYGDTMVSIMNGETLLTKNREWKE